MLKHLGLDRPLLALLRKILFLWVRSSVLPRDLAALGIDPSKPVVFVMQRRFLSNLLLLGREAEALGLLGPHAPLLADGLDEPRSFFFLNRSEPIFGRPPKQGYSPLLSRLVAAVRDSKQLDVQLLPVNILWGRAPSKENTIWELIFSDGWAPRGAFTQLLTVMLHGRNTMLKFGEPWSLRELVADSEDQERALRKVARVLRVHFRQQREMAIGPDLSHRRTQLEALLERPTVRAAIEAESGGAAGSGLRSAERKARHYAWEIAADYSYANVRLLWRFLNWLWTRLYDGVETGHLDTLHEVAKDHEVIYVPCHRSHIDYLLLSYIVFEQGLMVPHIAAGVNLNLPVVGGILRRGGAFFMRRSFKGNKIYAAVFNEYLHMMIAKGYPIEYFIEGGRSRTGRLLQPKGGMLSMTVQSYLRDPAKPIAFVPVYICYEKLFEGKSYVGELMGKTKKKESLFDLLGTLGDLKKNFGKVHLNVGEPIKLHELLDELQPDWKQDATVEGRPAWFSHSINELGQRIALRLNDASVANPVCLAALALLATPRHAMDAEQLANQLDGYRRLQELAPYSPRSKTTLLTGAEMVAYGERLKWLQRHPHALGDVIHAYPEDAVLLTYQRNNVLHYFALPALLAVLFSRNASLSREQLGELAGTVYPFLRAELFLRWTDADLPAALDRYLDALCQLGWLVNSGREGVYHAPNMNSDEYAQLTLLAQAIRPTLLRYFITLAVLTEQGAGAVTPEQLEGLCHLLAQRLGLLREFNAPEFFDKAIFRTFIQTLKERGLAGLDGEGKLTFDQALRAAAAAARYVLPADVRHSVLHLTRLEPATVQDALAKMVKRG